MRHGTFDPGTRDFRGRFLPTKHGHAGSARIHVRVTREYQSDSSSKRPASSVPWDSRPLNAEEEGLFARICGWGVVRGGMISPRRGRVGVIHSGASARPGGSVEGPWLMGAPRAECPAMDNPRTCLPRAVLGARGNPQILLRRRKMIEPEQPRCRSGSWIFSRAARRPNLTNSAILRKRAQFALD